MQSPSICLPSLPPPPKKTWWLFTTLKITRPDDPRSFSDLRLLTRFSCVRLCATPEMAAHQAPLSLGFSRQEHWSGLPFPSLQCIKVKSESEVAQSCLTPSDPMDCSYQATRLQTTLPGSSVHGICQARVLEWVAIAFSISRSSLYDCNSLNKDEGYFNTLT